MIHYTIKLTEEEDQAVKSALKKINDQNFVKVTKGTFIRNAIIEHLENYVEKYFNEN